VSDTINDMTNVIDQQQLAQELVEAALADGMELVGPGGLLTGLTKTVLETALEAEMSDSRDTISRITDTVLEQMAAWQARPPGRVYPVVSIDADTARAQHEVVRTGAFSPAMTVDLPRRGCGSPGAGVGGVVQLVSGSGSGNSASWWRQGSPAVMAAVSRSGW